MMADRLDLSCLESKQPWAMEETDAELLSHESASVSPSSFVLPRVSDVGQILLLCSLIKSAFRVDELFLYQIAPTTSSRTV